MRTFEETPSHRAPMSRTLIELLCTRLRRVLSLPVGAPADLHAAEAMIAAARCAFGPIEVGREGSGLRYSPTPEALGMPRQPSAEAPSAGVARRPLRECYPH